MHKLSYTVDEAAISASTNRNVIYAAIRAGTLRAKRQGVRTVILFDDLKAYTERLPDADLAPSPNPHAKRKHALALPAPSPFPAPVGRKRATA